MILKWSMRALLGGREKYAKSPVLQEKSGYKKPPCQGLDGGLENEYS